MRAYYLDSKLEEKLLVYDYMCTGSVATLLHVRKPKQPLNWATRMQIVEGVARGLHCLHTHHNIVHGNLTSSFVFLDENINPKISDFGLSQLITAVANLNTIQGPELSLPEKADTKTDIYSLGVFMLEILTRKSPVEIDLPQWVHSLIQEEWTHEVFDSELMLSNTLLEEEQMMKILQLALDCVSPIPR
ncbi:putative leucine-rich repeat receptor-like protein kinase IMK3 [Bidens hawaiensis]|uniref:putative leucine-rich repeat receptor-like protein kinase IMK3 n=1 Tax=Bidens hawaiensis TaxID=980011 RepID=UPI00404B138C